MIQDEWIYLMTGCIISLGDIFQRKTSIGSKLGDIAANKITCLYKIQLIYQLQWGCLPLVCLCRLDEKVPRRLPGWPHSAREHFKTSPRLCLAFCYFKGCLAVFWQRQWWGHGVIFPGKNTLYITHVPLLLMVAFWWRWRTRILNQPPWVS